MTSTSFDDAPLLHFEKWDSLGNDYLIIERTSSQIAISAVEVRAMCARNGGVGADGVLEVMRENNPIVGSIRIVNPDGSDAELSGNGTRQAILYMVRHGWTNEKTFDVLAPSGKLSAVILDSRTSRVALGRARVLSSSLRFLELNAVHVVIGNPQTALRIASVEALNALDLASLGSAVENSLQFPNRTNVSVWTPVSPSRINARIWERGVGLTSASGTGACGAAIAHYLESGQRHVNVLMAGGTLLVEIDEVGPSVIDVTLTGTASPIFQGSWVRRDRSCP
ncbi:diaminopimelate epimerase [Cryobacterium lyxosi]|uniref:Diaminopimelate epimerase n=1 Tax=Cryobacterium lyxosi TaxID=1259228 RepID=A0A4R8ZAJ9_9MICO|nr:diaminopimelate epimerase [Cryobacterium lyxosi]TFD23244.1 diaminopimelate epimerase [Cryobacterium lyxosi]